MASVWHARRAVPAIDPDSPHHYDDLDLGPDEGELLELPGPRARYEQLARTLRKDIYDGRYPVGKALRPEQVLAVDYGMSRALVNRALQVLAEEELVSQEQGRGTYVRPRRLYRVAVSVPLPEARRMVGAGALRRGLSAAAKNEPAVRAVESAGLTGDAAAVSLLVEAADGDWAVHAAKMVLRSAPAPWSWDGWDLTLASWRCDPAGMA
jgi:GntR family transcriptional regulator